MRSDNRLLASMDYALNRSRLHRRGGRESTSAASGQQQRGHESSYGESESHRNSNRVFLTESVIE
jgi:hypothetical protein